MFGITPLGWVHTLGSLPAIPAAAYMFAIHGRIVPRSTAGIVYLVSMLIGAVTVFFVTHMPAGHIIGALTLLLLAIGYTIGRTPLPARAVAYIETIVLSVTAFLLMLPTATEILRRVPDGHPFVTDLKSPLLLGVQAGILAALVIGVGAQIVYLRRTGGAASA
ncbi:hypothetical protein ASE61_06150 [Bosea sp. Root670]|uniref:hypothetical protein n=1 Tax=Bosea sp. Root670 TaxID=1736583 RepID=UPI000712C1F8|nr:hypothetical protein [Bosea sp. Root670]KRE04523.1 hypothetical protein ASE61_06150 [Bosea sp. Root670]